MRYDHRVVEPKWQRRWRESGAFRIGNDRSGKRAYILDMFPYPSGDGLHVGHPEGYTATDILCRYRRMRGQSVLHPIGWDAFGLPAENAALKKKTHPRAVTERNIKNFRRQIQSIGFSYDWDREINTTDPDYYRWTQWIFLQLYDRGLAYEQEAPIWWCPKDKTGLANEEVVNGRCERCGTAVERKMLKQWMLKITAYAERLLEGLEKLDWPESIKALQRNWIGKSVGARITFRLRGIAGQDDDRHSVDVFTTRPDTIFGATFLVISPELAQSWLKVGWRASKKVQQYLDLALTKSDIDRQDEGREKTGVDSGLRAVNPATEKEIPVWVADYVLGGYGTGAIMAVPAHDERDFAFAMKFRLPIRQVIAPFFRNTTDLPIQPDQPVIRRPVAYAIVHRKKDDRYLCLKWRKQEWGSFIVGGIERDEQPALAAKREIIEETGYKNVRHVASVDWQVHTEFFAPHKQENRYGIATGEVFELLDEARADVDQREKDRHEPVWVAAEKVRDFLTHANAKYIWDCYRQLTPYIGEGVVVHSNGFSGLSSEEGRMKIVAELKKRGAAQPHVQYKLRDWVFSRQRYWGEPIPLVHCDQDGVVPIPEDQLPVLLPDVDRYEPTGTGESPLAAIDEWVNTTCPQCGGPAKRETNTMPQWAGSCWYYLRFCDPKNDQEFASAKALTAWLPVSLYVGGAEHAVLHLLYARFWHKVLFDAGHIPAAVGDEPFAKLKNQGLILGPDGEKMSKSRGNVINPDEIISQYGADTLRMYEMFMGPFEDAKPWDTNGIVGVRRFLDKVWRASERVDGSKSNDRWHQYAIRVTEGIEQFRFNTVVSDFMKWANEWGTALVSRDEFGVFLRLLSPFAPHLCEELWAGLGKKTLLAEETWPAYDSKRGKSEIATIAVQVNGKHRGNIRQPSGSSESVIQAAAEAEPNVKKFLTKKPSKVIVVKDRLVNFVIKK